MKQIVKHYSFDVAARTITFSDFSQISLDRLLLITNVTSNQPLYQFNDPSLGGSASGNTLTLTADTNGMQATDQLQIIYDCASGDPIYDAYFDPASNADVNLATAIAGEDLANNVMGTVVKPAITNEYDLSYSTAFGTSVATNSKPTPGNVFSAYASNENAAKRYLQLHNKATAPTTGNVPFVSIPIPAGSATAPASITVGRSLLGDNGHYCSTGVSWGISTTRDTFTAATPADHDVMVTFI